LLLLLLCINDEALEVKNWSAAAGGILDVFFASGYGRLSIRQKVKNYDRRQISHNFMA
jgi:hypothetical protein